MGVSFEQVNDEQVNGEQVKDEQVNGEQVNDEQVRGVSKKHLTTAFAKARQKILEAIDEAERFAINIDSPDPERIKEAVKILTDRIREGKCRPSGDDMGRIFGFSGTSFLRRLDDPEYKEVGELWRSMKAGRPGVYGAPISITPRRESKPEKPAKTAAKSKTMLVDSRAAAEICGLSVQSWHRLAKTDGAPHSIKIGAKSFWFREEIERWLRRSL